VNIIVPKQISPFWGPDHYTLAGTTRR